VRSPALCIGITLLALSLCGNSPVVKLRLKICAIVEILSQLLQLYLTYPIFTVPIPMMLYDYLAYLHYIHVAGTALKCYTDTAGTEIVRLTSTKKAMTTRFLKIIFFL